LHGVSRTPSSQHRQARLGRERPLHRSKRCHGIGAEPTDAPHAPVAKPERAVGPPALAVLGEVDGVFTRTVRRGGAVFRRGQAFANLYVVSAGSIKLVSGGEGGHEQVVALHLPGDWLGLDGIAGARYCCDAIAMDAAEVWGAPYAALLAAASRSPGLLGALHAAMSREIMRDRDQMVLLNLLPVTARVAAFLHRWADDLASRGLRNDRITLRLTRAEIGRHLGLSLETVSRVMTALERQGLVEFREGRRDLVLADPAALAALAGGTG
jgi:CRP/FNR family transcriptional regulator